jgi:dienelactone hydrolase/Tol biopolymer transport system component
MFIHATDNSWKKEFPGGTQIKISGDDKFAVVKQKDTLSVMDLSSKKVKVLGKVTVFELPNEGTWLVYKVSTDEQGLSLYHLKTEKYTHLDHVKRFQFNDQNDEMILFSDKSLTLLTLSSMKSTLICNDTALQTAVCSNNSEYVAFVTLRKDSFCIYLYDKKEGICKEILSNQLVSNQIHKTISNNSIRFSKNDRYLYFNVGSPKVNNSPVALANVVIKRTYKPEADTTLQRGEYVDFPYVAAYNLDDHSIFQITENNEKIISEESKRNGDHLVIEQFLKGKNATYADSLKFSALYLYSLQDHQKKLISGNVFHTFSTVLSPNGKYVVFYDKRLAAYFCYDTETGTLKNISEKIGKRMYHSEGWGRKEPPPDFEIGGWLEGDQALYIYDEFDIWQVDPLGISSAKNITKGLGSSQKIVFRFLEGSKKTIIDPSNENILLAFDKNTKNNGFYSINLLKGEPPQMLTMSPHVYFLPRSALNSLVFLGENGMVPIKAKYGHGYLMLKLSCRESPNLFYTSDFKKQVQLTSVYPEKMYNWIHSQLITYIMPGGANGEGILYKPDDFDSTKTYPVIFYFYEHTADFKNQFLFPGATSGQLPIANFVSNGYLVCVPNIYYESGNIAGSVYNSVMSAYRRVSQLRFVDSTKVGIQGHSLGGYEVMSLVTQTPVFAAAASAAGASNLISNYTLSDGGITMSEEGSYRLDARLWSQPAVYIRNSPIFYADRIETPLLIQVGHQDDRVPYEQGIEMFKALQWLGKKAWLVEYPTSGHSLRHNDSLDYNGRLFDFFNYYLKGSEMPQWMRN